MRIAQKDFMKLIFAIAMFIGIHNGSAHRTFHCRRGRVVNRGHCRIKLIRHFIENTRLFQGQLQSGTQITKTGTMMFKAE